MGQPRGPQFGDASSGLDDIQIKNIGIGLDITDTFSPLDGTVQSNTGISRINQSLRIIFNTRFGEVPMLPVLGSNIPYVLFEPSDEVLADLIDLYVREAIEQLEPRIKVSDVIVDTDDHIVYVSVIYVLTNTNIAHRFDFNITRENRGDVSV